MRRPRTSVLWFTVALLLGTTQAPRAAIFTRVPELPARARALAVRPGTGLLSVDAAEVAAFRAAGGGRLDLPAPDGAILSLALVPMNVLAPGAQVTFTDASGPHPLAIDATVFKGRVIGDSASWAVVTLSPSGALGIVSQAGRLWQLSPVSPPGPGTLPLHVLAPSGALDDVASTFRCGIDAGNEQAMTVGVPATRPRQAAPDAVQLNAPRKVFGIAIECDYELYVNKFSANVANEANYVLTLLGTVSLIYERDLEATLDVPYLNFWTTNVGDPYTAATTGTQLPQFASYWINNLSGVPRAVAHLLSGRALGGGIAYIGTLCDNSYGFSVSAIDATYSFPSNTTSWDATVVAHELGHNFGSWHTHSCQWAALGLAPVNALLDTCQASEGGCTPVAPRLPPDKGTIMSYCHLLTGGMSNIRLDFHPVCITRMRTWVDGSCGSAAAVGPPRNPATSSAPTGVHVGWAASSSAGVLSYDVYRGKLPLDLDPVKIGTTTGLSFDDIGLGTQYYKVKAVRAADTSAFSAEVKFSLCPFTAPPAYTVGAQPGDVLSGDFNADGIPDLVFANSSSTTLSVLAGQGAAGAGNGTFGAAVTVNTGGSPQCLAQGDFNGDGILDLLAGCADDSSIYVHLGHGAAGAGDGTFAAGVRVPLGLQPTSIAVADFDEDGYPDLAVAGAPTGLAIVRGNGAAGVPNGTFAAPVLIALGALTRGVAVGDFNRDGVWDLATSAGPQLKVLLGLGTGGKGNGTFGPAANGTPGSTPFDIAVADLNLDGADDVLVCNSGASSVSVFLGQLSGGLPTGTFPIASLSAPSGANPRGIKIGDWNADGVPDLVVANSGAGVRTVSLMTGKGDGTFNPPQPVTLSANAPYGLAACDFNHDGGIDLAAPLHSQNTAGLVLSGCANALPVALALSSPAGGESWIANDERTITWTRGVGATLTDVQLSRDSGSSWQTLARNVTGTSFTWTVTGAATAHARVRVRDPQRPQVSAATAADFAIAASALEVPPAGLASRFGVLGTWPNPARGTLTISLALPEGGPGAMLELLDLAGRRLDARSLDGLGAGVHEVTLRGGPALRPGIYLVRMRQGSQASTRKVAMLR